MGNRGTLKPTGEVNQGEAGNMGPHGMRLSVEQLAEFLQEEDRQLAAARETFPQWRIVQVFGGFMAIPAGPEPVSATTVDGLVEKLRELEA